MGRDSKQRRDARRKRSRGASSTGSSTQRQASHFWRDDEWLARADFLVVAQLNRLAGRKMSADDAALSAELLVRRAGSLPLELLVAVVAGRLDEQLDRVTTHGWDTEDLRQTLHRQSASHLLPLLDTFLDGDAGPRGADLHLLAQALHLATVLASLPALPETTPLTSTRPDEDDQASRRLATVRALLAKAESTVFDDEAEALTAKAQQLISRYALDHLLATETSPSDKEELAVRRIWLDAPYVVPKGLLVDAVASANRSRAVLLERLGVVTILGSPSELDAVEMLVTSLLVQASSALQHHARQAAGSPSRSRSFRQSFLVAFAHRIGERLRDVSETAVRDHKHQAQLLPALRSKESALDDAVAALFGQTVAKATSVTSHAGWGAGLAAADLAQLDIGEAIRPAG